MRRGIAAVRASHKVSGVVASSEVVAKAGTSALRKMTLRWRLERRARKLHSYPTKVVNEHLEDRS